MRHRSGSVAGLGMAAITTVLALLMPSGGAVATGAAPPDRPTTTRATTHLLTPAHGPRVSPRFFGMHVPRLAEELPDAPVGAVDLTTNGVYWPTLEPSPGGWDFSRLDAVLAQARADGVTPLVVLGGTPAFHSTSAETPSWPSVPRMSAWKAFVTAVTAHVAATHAGAVDYQIWPEPNVPNNFTGTPQQMADLVAAAAGIIHRTSADATVVAPAMVLRFRGERRFMTEFFDAEVRGTPVGDLVDAVGVDPYPLEQGTPEDALALVRNAQRSLAAAGVTAPVWSLEINYGVPTGGVTSAAPMPPRTQAAYVIRTYVTSAAAGVRRVYWLGWMRYYALAVSMVQSDGVTPTAAGRAFARVHDWLVGRRARGCTHDRTSGVYACTFVRNGSTSRIYWVASGTAKVRVPAGARRVQRMTGAVSRVRPGDPVRVTGAPVLVYR